MGNQSSIMSYNRMPNALLTFGRDSQSPENLEEVQALLNGLNKIIGVINNNRGENSTSSIQLVTKIGRVAGPAGPVISIILTLIEETDKLQAELNKLETRIQTIEFDGSLTILRNIVSIIQHPQTNSVQLLSEIGFAIHEFQRLLPKFTREDSVLYIKYYLGAPLFVQICGLFKAILLIATNTPEYNNPELENIICKYQDALDSFRIRCIRERCRSIYFHNKFKARMFWHFYYKDLMRFPTYFDGTKCAEIHRMDKRESSEKEQLWHAKEAWFDGRKYDNMYDEWDDRKRNEIDFQTIDLCKDEKEFGNFVKKSLNRKAIYNYRLNVITLMENYFQAANFNEFLRTVTKNN